MGDGGVDELEEERAFVLRPLDNREPRLRAATCDAAKDAVLRIGERVPPRRRVAVDAVVVPFRLLHCEHASRARLHLAAALQLVSTTVRHAIVRQLLEPG